MVRVGEYFSKNANKFETWVIDIQDYVFTSLPLNWWNCIITYIFIDFAPRLFNSIFFTIRCILSNSIRQITTKA